MIKINLKNREEIESNHLGALRDVVKSRINEKRLNTEKGSSLYCFLYYLETNIDTILCGNRSELERIIKKIEARYYISKRKLSKIVKKREGELVGRKQIRAGIMKFIDDNSLSNHLSSKPYSYTNITEFNEEIKSLTSDKWKDYGDILKDIFNYKEFTTIKEGWSAYTLVNLTEINVCPYCNRSFVTTLMPEEEEAEEIVDEDVKEKKRTRAVLDHYYAKSLYPYLALSLYNLIPSCYVCNSSFKGEKDFYKNEAIHPYEEDFLNLVTFKTDFNDTRPYDYRYLLGISKEFKINLEIDKKDEDLEKKAVQSIETFKLEDLYNTHLDIVRDLIRNGIVNNESRINELCENENLKGLFSSREEIIQSLFVNYVKDEGLGKRPFAKLTQDICKELGLLGPPK